MRTKIVFPENVLFQTKLAVRINDINYGMHLAHDKVISLLHEARAQCLRYLKFSEVDIGGCGLIMSDLNVQYLSEAFYAEELCIKLACEEYRKKYLVFYYQITRDDELIALAKTGMMAFDYALRKTVSIPKSFLEKIGLSK